MTFITRYIVKRTNKAEIRPEEQSEKTESCWEKLWNEIHLKGPKRQKCEQARLIHVRQHTEAAFINSHYSTWPTVIQATKCMSGQNRFQLTVLSRWTDPRSEPARHVQQRDHTRSTVNADDHNEPPKDTTHNTATTKQRQDPARCLQLCLVTGDHSYLGSWQKEIFAPRTVSA